MSKNEHKNIISLY